MYDWPEAASRTDAFWSALRDALTDAGIDAPDTLDRATPSHMLWRDPGLVVSQTCGWPLTAHYSDTLHVVARPGYAVEGCGPGTYRSAIVARRDAPVADLARGRIAVNGFDSLSGYWTLAAHLAGLGLTRGDIGPVVETGSHRASVRCVAAGRAEIAAIDCVSWQLARDHEPAAHDLVVIGWTAELPALPFVTSRANAARDGVIRAALAKAAAASPQPFLAAVRPASAADYDTVVSLGESARAAGF